MEIEIPARFCGPPDMANGGYLAGRLAALLGGVADVSLRRATPLDRPLLIERFDGGLRLLDGDAVLAEARAAEAPDVELPEPVSLADAATAARSFPRFVDHPVPGCFVCGTERPDGFRIFPGPVPGREEIYAAPWTPDPSLGDETSLVRPEFLWAALDCTGAFAVNEPPRGLALLARIAARIDERPRVGEPLVVIGWPIAREGRRLEPGTAILTPRGRAVAVARATWVLTNPRRPAEVS